MKNLILTIITIILFQLTVAAYDTAFPQQRTEANVNIFVVRNENPPFFIDEPYSARISEELDIGVSIINVRAVDNDNVSTSIIAFK